MVSAISPFHMAEFVSGRLTVEPFRVSMEAWAEIIRDAAMSIVLPERPKPESFMSIKKLLSYDGPYGVRREMKSNVTHAEWGQPSPNLTFAELHAWDSFPDWDVAIKNGHGVPATILTKHLVLSYRKELFVLEGTWAPRERWDEDLMASRPCDFWYEAERISMGNTNVLSYIVGDGTRDGYINCGLSVLRKLRDIAEEIRASDEARLEASEQQKLAYVARLERLRTF